MAPHTRSAMRHTQLIYREDKDRGFWGLCLANRPHFDPGDGRTIAHDVLEHFPDDDGSMEHEYLALGALMHVRDGSAWLHDGPFPSRTTLGYTLASETIEQFHYHGADYQMRLPPRHRPVDPDDEVEEAIQEAARLAPKLLAAKFHYDDRDIGQVAWLQDPSLFAGWLRAGYVRARRRYRGYSSLDLHYTFRDIARVVNAWLDAAKQRGYPLGTRLRLDVSLRRREARLVVTEPGWDYR